MTLCKLVPWTARRRSHNVNNELVSLSGFLFSQHAKSSIPKKWILLDNQSTENLFCNTSPFLNVRKGVRQLNVNCNAGVQTTKMVGELPGFDRVWVDKNAVANILSFPMVREKYNIKYDGVCNRFVVTTRP